jgi:hypothetical protein
MAGQSLAWIKTDEKKLEVASLPGATTREERTRTDLRITESVIWSLYEDANSTEGLSRSLQLHLPHVGFIVARQTNSLEMKVI